MIVVENRDALPEADKVKAIMYIDSDRRHSEMTLLYTKRGDHMPYGACLIHEHLMSLLYMGHVDSR